MMTLTLMTAMARRLACRFQSGAAWTFAAVKTARERRALAQLRALDDRMLRDIGLERSDLLDAMSLPLGQDAGSFLEDRRRARPGQSALFATKIAALSAGTISRPANQAGTARRAA